MVRGRKTLSFMKGRGEVTLARVHLPSMYLLYQSLAVFRQNILSPAEGGGI